MVLYPGNIFPPLAMNRCRAATYDSNIRSCTKRKPIGSLYSRAERDRDRERQRATETVQLVSERHGSEGKDERGRESKSKCRTTESEP